ncbi:MAG TPA: sigma-54 dependent transcriptional regulator [Thermoanaerobaculia bacterium]|nr:sigma-54 dependent transcriptional regulator [Thermoanaerobaculia bacterium]
MSERSERILIVDDEAGIRSTLSGILEDEGYGVAAVGTAAEATARLGAEAFDAVLLDLWLPDRDGMELLSELREQPVIVISGHASVDTAVKATRLGAYDFLEKPLSLSRVVVTVQNALERGRLARELQQLSDRLARAEPLLGGSPRMQRLKAELATAARSESRILILGENGTGKELVARQVHRLSGRSRGPFVEVNCAAIPEDLIESELFGHVRGAFTGAVGDRPGRFEQADGGTLFLDEVADMSLKTQARVLRVLQEQRFERVGGTSPIRVDVRVLAATNKDLEDEIRQGRFREDLYFRLAVIPLRVPPLRERAEDVPILAAHFIALFAHELKQRPKAVDREAMRLLEEYAWPGNVRELRNLVERMMIMVPGATIAAADLAAAIRADGGSGGSGGAGGSARASAERALWEADYASLREARGAFEKHFIERKLAELEGNVSRTAQVLGLERSNLYRKMRAYGIEVERNGAAAAGPGAGGDPPHL